MDTEAPDVFEIRLTNNGTSSIKKFSKLAASLVLIGLLNVLIMFGLALARLQGSYDYSQVDLVEEIYFRSIPYFNLIYGILLIIQLYYYWRIRKLLLDSLMNKDEISFNKSFSALVKNAIWGIVSLTFAVLFSIFDSIVYFKYYY